MRAIPFLSFVLLCAGCVATPETRLVEGGQFADDADEVRVTGKLLVRGGTVVEMSEGAEISVRSLASPERPSARIVMKDGQPGLLLQGSVGPLLEKRQGDLLWLRRTLRKFGLAVPNLDAMYALSSAPRTSSETALRLRFAELYQQQENLDRLISSLQQDATGNQQQIANLRESYAQNEREMAGIREALKGMRADVTGLKTYDETIRGAAGAALEGYYRRHPEKRPPPDAGN
jgi:hypothetical protein